ncbi:hypothetical protein B4110_3243 [Parageobacillus toebii]|uniref:Uncharacterized protein n=1 Tax=Parageobacillus toebii TaxID=153151 RepID=A0A150MGQ0_9BACL|nr:hypothetical protein B4110_3243 [Parageobacillus toebii]
MENISEKFIKKSKDGRGLRLKKHCIPHRSRHLPKKKKCIIEKTGNP